MKTKTVLMAALFGVWVAGVCGAETIEHLRSQVRSGVNYIRDGSFTISHLEKQKMSDELTFIRGFITNDTTRRAVSVQLEVTCYNRDGDLLGTQMVEINYLNSRETQPFQARIRKDADQITLFEARVQDFIWDE